MTILTSYDLAVRKHRYRWFLKLSACCPPLVDSLYLPGPSHSYFKQPPRVEREAGKFLGGGFLLNRILGGTYVLGKRGNCGKDRNPASTGRPVGHRCWRRRCGTLHRRKRGPSRSARPPSGITAAISTCA